MLISVVIATLNRPGMLGEAIGSVAGQTYEDWELVVVDDGSAPCVDLSALVPKVRQRTVLVRNAAPTGVPRAKNAGLRAASGEVVLHLDDDDLLKPQALAQVAASFRSHRELDCVFLNVEPFGPYAPGSVENQHVALQQLLAGVSTHEENGLVFLGDGLFQALLASVPLALQRPAARRGTWNVVGGYREDLLFSEPDWAIRAAMTCRTALLMEPLSRWRCEGQNFASRPERRAQALQTQLRSAELLVGDLEAQEHAMHERVRAARRRLANTYFDVAYHSAGRHDGGAWKHLMASLVRGPGLRHLKLAGRLALGGRGTKQMASAPERELP